MEENTIYPEAVIEQVEYILKEVFADNQFFIENDIRDFDLGMETARKCMSDLFTEKFIAGEELMFSDEEELHKLLCKINAETALRSLAKKGLIDYYFDDDKKEDVFFLTEKGKQVGNHL